MKTPSSQTNSSEGSDIQAERERIFTIAFWSSLLSGREGLGDTFWFGNYLFGLMAFPLIFLIAIQAPLDRILSIVSLLFSLYFLVVARAVSLSKPKGDAGAGWKIAGVFVTLLHVASTFICAL
ncbi:MAG: hypothetical protein P8X77_00600, partial [Maritimibacter sp.]